MKLPKFLDIKGRRYRLKIAALPPNIAGYCYPDRKLIELNSSLDSAGLLETLLHEMGHAIMFELHIDQTSIHRDLLEIVVEGFAQEILRNARVTF